MTLRLPSLTSLLALLALITFLTPLHTAFATESDSRGLHGAVYQSNQGNTLDFREISTLNSFDLLVARDRWRGIDANDVLAAFSRFDGVQGSPALREIWRNVLLGDFSGLNIQSGQQQSILMAERIRLLNRLGFFDEAVRLYLEASKRKPIPESLAEQGIEALAMSGSADGACLETLMAARTLHSDGWAEDAALCSAYFGDKTKAQDFRAQIRGKADEGFTAVYNMLSSSAGKTIQVGIPPLWRSLLLAKGATISGQALRKADGMTVSALAQNEHVPLGIRLAAASRAADLGTIGADKLRQLYEMKHPGEDSAKSVSSEGGLQSDMYAAARFTFEGNARATIVRNAMRSLKPLTNIKGHVYGWIVDKLTLQGDKLAWFAPYGFALMTETDRRDSADLYYDIGHLDHSPLAVVYMILEQKPWSPDSQKIWAAAMEQSGKGSAIARAYNVAKAFDQENKLALNQNAVIRTDESKPTGILTDSLRHGGRGLTLITALNALASAREMSRLPAPETSEIIAVLGKEGLFGERKKIALEILLQTVL